MDVTVDIATQIAQTYQELGLGSVKTGDQNDILVILARQQADFMANSEQQGHQLFEEQFQKYNGDFPRLRSICAESWQGQSFSDAIVDFVKSWRQSPGHYAYLNGKCKSYGFWASQGQNGIWYGCGMFSD